MRMGIPRVLTSDQGSEFNNAINRELTTLLQIKHRLTTAYHPQVTIIIYYIIGVSILLFVIKWMYKYNGIQ